METLYISKDAKLEREDSTLVVKVPDAGKRRVPVETLKHVVIAGESGMTSQVLSLFGRNDVRVTILDWYGNVVGCFEPLSKPTAAVVRLAQARHASDHELRLDMAKRIVEGAMANILANLNYRAYRGNSGLGDAISRIKQLRECAASATTIEQLMGFEGNSRAWYYASWKLIDPRLDFGARKRRPPNNPINCLISWFNGLSYTLVRNEIAKTHLDDCISFLHSPTEARHSLALDLSEPFKPTVVDTLIFEAVSRGLVQDNWFHQEEGVCRLSETGRKRTLEMWAAKTETANGDSPTIRDLIRREALAVERHLLGINPYSAYRRRI